MQFNIGSFLKRINSKKINLPYVVNEAVVNSIQAGANKIDIKFNSRKNPLLIEGIKNPDLIGFSITDNGQGFNQENIKSFCQYGSQFKEKLGCKGVGRLYFLKVFNEVKIVSKFKGGNEVNALFNESFSSSSFSEAVLNEPIANNETTLSFLESKEICNKSMNEVKEKLFTNILPTLYLQKGEIIINIFDESNVLPPITTKNLPPLQTINFTIQELISQKKENIEFKLSYSIQKLSSSEGIIYDFYCANNRTVCNFKDKGFKISPYRGFIITFLLTSEYFDKQVIDSRNDFNIPKKDSRFDAVLSWESINDELQQHVSNIMYANFPVLKEQNTKIIEDLKNENLHLLDYLQDIDSLGGLINASDIIERAEKAFLKDKIDFREEVKQKKGDLTLKQVEKAKTLAGSELIEYVLTRDKILSQFEIYNANNEKSEKLIHDLILKKGIDGDELSPISLNENNLWLIDDKFMSYSYAASDKTIKSALKNININESDNLQRPDISIFFQNKQDNHNAVIIELKAFGLKAKGKFAGLKEIMDYAREIKQHQKLKHIWLYLITKIDDEFKRDLIAFNYKSLFSNDENIFFNYYEHDSIYIYILSSESLLADAKARNKAFIDIVKLNNGLLVEKA